MNTIQLMGAVVDKELRYTPNGKPILDITLAATGEQAPWYQRVTIFNRNAERYADTPPGSVMHIHGRLQHDRWEAHDGTKRSAVKVIVNDVHMFDGDFKLVEDKRGQALLQPGLHAVTIAGNATRSVEARQTPNGSVATVPIAVNQRKRVNGEWVDDPHYFDVQAWSDEPAWSVVSTVARGDSLWVQGVLRNRSWEGEDGQRRFKTELQASLVQRVVKPGVVAQQAVASGGALDIDEFPEAGSLPF